MHMSLGSKVLIQGYYRLLGFAQLFLSICGKQYLRLSSYIKLQAPCSRYYHYTMDQVLHFLYRNGNSGLEGNDCTCSVRESFLIRQQFENNENLVFHAEKSGDPRTVQPMFPAYGCAQCQTMGKRRWNFCFFL